MNRLSKFTCRSASLLLIFALAVTLCGCFGTPPVETLSTTVAEPSGAETTGASETTYPPATVPAVTTAASTAEESTAEPKKPYAVTGKVVALTFDDGPSLSVTPQILDLLEKYNAKATFFVLGSNLTESKASILRRTVALGCEIGNHSETHHHFTEMTSADLLAEVRGTNRKIEAYTGERVTLLRPPGGNVDLNVMKTLYQNGVRMYTTLWSVDSRDWAFNASCRDGEMTVDEAVEKTCELIYSEMKEGSIILMHDVKEITPAVLARVLEKLTAEGYTFVTVSELFAYTEMGDAAYYSKFYERGRTLDLR